MAETLGTLCDKLTIVKLKHWHTEDADRKQLLEKQAQQLQTEINEFVAAGYGRTNPGREADVCCK